jgi:hypothetical protein
MFFKKIVYFLIYLHGICTKKSYAHDKFASHLSDTCHLGTLIHIPLSTDYPLGISNYLIKCIRRSSCFARDFRFVKELLIRSAIIISNIA